MKLSIGSLTSTLVTDNSGILRGLCNKYAYPIPGYQYTPSYRSRRWDGKKRYISKKGVFKTGILDRVLDDLKLIGVDLKKNIEWDYKNPPALDIPLKKVSGFQYREYQEDAIKHCLKKRRAIVDSPTGSGKTLIMAGVVASILSHIPDAVVTILFREKGILNQTLKFFQKCGIPNLGFNSGEGYQPGNVMLSTVQSIDRIIDTHLNESEILMVDEAHQFCKGETTVAAIESFPNALYRLAFTATPPGEGAKDINARMTLEGAFGSVYTTRTADDLIKDGSLAKPIIQIIETTPEELPPEDISYIDAYDQFIVDNDQRNEKIKVIVDKIYESNPGSKVLILVKNLKHITNLKDLIPNCYTVEGKDDIGSRYDIISHFVNEDNPATIIGTNVMQTGISIDEITHMINARGLEGEIPTIQGLGRGIRKAEGKDTMYFYDFYDKVPYLEKHSKSRIKHYTKLKFEVNNVKL